MGKDQDYSGLVSAPYLDSFVPVFSTGHSQSTMIMFKAHVYSQGGPTNSGLLIVLTPCTHAVSITLPRTLGGGGETSTVLGANK